MNENHELNDMIKNIWYTMEHQAKNVKTIKNCVVFFTVFMIIPIVVLIVSALEYLYYL